MPGKPNIFVYHNELLPYSATFIRTQAAALRSFRVGFAGIFPTRRASLDLQLDLPPVLMTRDHRLISRIRRTGFIRRGLFGKHFLRELASYEPALIHAHFALDACTILEVAEELGIPLVVTLHCYDVTVRDDILARSQEGKVYLRRRERLWERTAHFFSSCDYIGRRAIERGAPASKLETLYSGHDFSRFAIPPVERDRNLIVYLGRLVEKKGCRMIG